MARFFLIFVLTFVIGFFSVALSMAVNALLFFMPHAPLPSPEKVPYVVPRLLSLAIQLVPGIAFIAWKGKKGSPAWVAWVAGLPALAISYVLFWALFVGW